MRYIWVTVLFSLCVLGCRHPRSNDSSAQGAAASRVVSPAPKPGVGSPAPARPESGVVAVKERTGRIASVNATLRFVVIDFYLSELPQVGQIMSVYRQGQKVAQLKISGPEKSRNIAADVVAGEVRVGDEVRTD